MGPGFHPEAQAEHLAQIAYYEGVQAGVGARCAAAVEAAIAHIDSDPLRFPVACEPGIRRCPLKRFPFTVFFRESAGGFYIYAVAPHRRDPDYWKTRR
ncbi:MAG TPA: type II toxin-antitoxin system RelE/ParE family toxin [Rubrivivax sp.]|nr:type II toxin-antitoxin system RelE/ParE family toxin [Rubrivivax sp.]